MANMNNILKELKISKVKLASILGVSRQMVYNYLQMDDINDWPIDKVEKLLASLDIKSIDELNKISKSKEQLLKVKEGFFSHDDSKIQSSNNAPKLSQVSNNLINTIKTKLIDDKITSREINICFEYLNEFIKVLDEFDEFKYVLEYFAKNKGLINPRSFSFNNEEQIIFEGIMYQAMALYHNGGASRSKIIESQQKMIREIEYIQEERLSRTEELHSIKEKALKELGYKEINESNASEVSRKMDEIENRKN